MINDALIEKLAAALAAQLPPPIPIEIDLWDVATIARLSKRNESQVRNRIVFRSDFPKAVRLPVVSGPRLYRAADVLAWVDKYQDKYSPTSVVHWPGRTWRAGRFLWHKWHHFPYPAVVNFGRWLFSR